MDQPVREIPGYFYDAEKKRYFKIEGNTAPATAAWSAESVKRRRAEDEQAEIAEKRAKQASQLVSRSRVLQDPLLGGFLLREVGQVGRDVQVDCWALGLCYKGNVHIPPNLYGMVATGAGLEVGPIYVDNDNATGHGVLWAVAGDTVGLSAVITTDDHDRIKWDYTNPIIQANRPLNLSPYLLDSQFAIQGISAMKYHKPSRTMIVTTRTACEYHNHSPPIYLFETTEPDYHNPNGDGAIYAYKLLFPFPKGKYIANTSAPAPASASGVLCVVGTDRGLLKLTSAGKYEWSIPVTNGKPGHSDVLSVDFLPQNPDVVVAGMRGSRKVALADTRAPHAQWDHVHHPSAAAHLRCLNEYHVLVAGPRSAMSIYDIRYRKEKPRGNRPIVIFPEFHNRENIHFGFDVDVGLGIAAVADGNYVSEKAGVGLYSLKTGKRLDVPALEGVRGSGVTKSLMFQTLPGEDNPSLFVSGKSKVHKYSFGDNVDEWDGEVFSKEEVVKTW